MKKHKDDPPWCGQRATGWKPAHHASSLIILGDGTLQSCSLGEYAVWPPSVGIRLSPGPCLPTQCTVADPPRM